MFQIKADGETAIADADVCKRVGELLTEFYPGHLWCVGTRHDAGVVLIDLPYQKPAHLRHMGYMLHLSSVLGSEGTKKVMRAGGELLERFGLARSGAVPETNAIASEHGLDVGNAVLKSKY